ncbi:MAG TPA: hypothetical protein VMR74_07750 [Gammaproteobacteria bacterium]|nr:hypothetical protein [Gammaproteobacteria bacterium]
MRVILSSAVIVVLAAGCAVTTVDGERLRVRSDAFPDYVESVFRRQNEIATALALAIDDETPGSGRYAALEAAELELLTACRGLNELAEASRDGEGPRGLAALQRARLAPDCERATNNAAEELE